MIKLSDFQILDHLVAGFPLGTTSIPNFSIFPNNGLIEKTKMSHNRMEYSKESDAGI